MHKFGLLIFLILLLGGILPTTAQESGIITRDNILSLQSVAQMDFAAVSARGLSPASGLFAVDADGSVLVSFANAEGMPPLSTLVIWDTQTGDILKTIETETTHFERQLSADGRTLALATESEMVLVDLVSGEREIIVEDSDPFLSVWFSATGAICAETTPDPAADGVIRCTDGREMSLFEGAQDFVRIGRVPPPLSVTVTDAGLVSRWDLEAATITAQADAGDIAVFGAVNVDGAPESEGSGSHLAWRDPPSQNLYILDFESGINTKLAELDSGFIAHLLLSRFADVIVGVDPMAARGALWAWDAESGEQLEVGNIRPCQRQQPDLARFTWDGTALIIGCDLGLEVWRVES